MRKAANEAPKPSAVRRAFRFPSLRATMIKRSPSFMRSTGAATANPTSAAGRPADPKARHLGSAAGSGAPRPSAESATGAQRIVRPPGSR